MIARSRACRHGSVGVAHPGDRRIAGKTFALLSRFGPIRDRGSKRRELSVAQRRVVDPDIVDDALKSVPVAEKLAVRKPAVIVNLADGNTGAMFPEL